MAGLTATGFTVKSLNDVKSETEADIKTAFGATTDVSTTSINGQYAAIFGEQLASAWEELEAIYLILKPDNAEGIQLDDVALLNGLQRRAPTYSYLGEYLVFGTATTVVPAGTQFYNTSNPGVIFETVKEITLAAGTDEVQRGYFSQASFNKRFRIKHGGYYTDWIDYNATTAEIDTALEDLISIDTVTVTDAPTTSYRILEVTFTGKSGKQPQNLMRLEIENTPEADNDFVVMTTGVIQGTTPIRAILAGPTELGPAYTVISLVTPVTGVTGGINTEDVTPGKPLETDTEFKARRKLAFALQSTSSIKGLQARLLEDYPDIEFCTILENDTDSTDGDGRPPHSFEVYLLGDPILTDTYLQQNIAETIAAHKPCGIESTSTAGTSFSVTVPDLSGTDQVIEFSYVDVLDIYVDVNISIDTSTFPLDGVDQIKTKIIEYINGLTIGQNVVYFPYLIGSISGIAGIKSGAVYVGTSASPTGTSNITVAKSQVADTDSTKVTVSFS